MSYILLIQLGTSIMFSSITIIGVTIPLRIELLKEVIVLVMIFIYINEVNFSKKKN